MNGIDVDNMPPNLGRDQYLPLSSYGPVGQPEDGLTHSVALSVMLSIHTSAAWSVTSVAESTCMDGKNRYMNSLVQ
jgi:hypothetical protein